MEYGRAVIVEDLSAAELGVARSAVYDRAIGLRTLYENSDTGAEHYLIRYPRGLKTRLHRHTAAHTILVLEGRIQVNDQVVGPGSYCHFPAGEAMTHAPEGDDSCLFVIIFDGPVDALPVDE